MIDILLASYNGEKYITEQIESILNQTYKDWFLYIKDDCSTDNTVKIINAYEKRYKDKIKVIVSDKPSGSAKDNFFSILQYSKSDYIMTCDQDDVWIPEKIEITYNKMKEAENAYKEIPILVHTDLKVADENLNVISDSLLKMQNLDSSRDKLNNLLVQNIVTGCTVMVNRKLLDYIKTIPKYAIMHDWWMALIASSLGKIEFIEKPTVLYRQHKYNDVGAKDVNSANYILKRLSNINDIKKSISDTYLQSEEVLNSLGNLIDKNNYLLVNQYSLMTKFNKVKKILILLKYKLWKNSLMRVLGQIIFC
jgi:glycosyltransferase involved in cell wall biosynthesis